MKIIAGHDLNVAGTVTGKNDVTLNAGNNVTTTALKDTSDELLSREQVWPWGEL